MDTLRDSTKRRGGAARDAIIERAGAKVDDPTAYDLEEQVKRGVRTRLGPNRWAQAYAAARVISIDTVLQEIEAAMRKKVSARPVVASNKE